jgi:hypothetical protein
MAAPTRGRSAPTTPHVATVLVTLALIAILGARAGATEGDPAPDETAVTAPAALTVGPHLSDHPAPGFTLTGFPSDLSLLVRLWIAASPDGVTMAIGDPTGLTISAGTGGWSGKRQLGFRGSAAAVQAALDTLTLTTGAATGELDLRIEVHPDAGPTADLVIEPRTGHLYRFVAGSPTWFGARDSASSAALAFDGVDGHLVTITSAEENSFVRANVPLVGRLWLGLSDRDIEGRWRWETGPEGAATGGDGRAGLRLTDTGYSAWDSGQPDDSIFSGDLFQGEDFGVMTNDGSWHDRASVASVGGYVVEYSAWGGRSFPSSRTATFTTVIGRPPRGVSAAAGNGRATVTWEAPEFGTVTGYTVTTALADVSDTDEATDEDGADALPGCATDGALSCIVRGLTNDIEVVFSVEATFTDEGTSRSTPSAAVMPVAPPPPPPPPPTPDPELPVVDPTGENVVPLADPVAPAADQPPASEPTPPLETPQGTVTDPDAPGDPAGTETTTDGPAPDDVRVAAATTDPDAERRPPFPTFSALEEPKALVATVTSGLALLGVAGSAGAAAAAAGAAAGAGRGPGGGSRASGGGSGAGSGSGGRDDGGQEVEREGVTGIDVLALGVAVSGEAQGDRSRLWRWPGTARMDRASAALMRRTAVALPLVARVVEDGAALRAMFGSLALLLPLSGMVLGVASALDTGGIAMPPSTALMATIVLLGLLDASTGLVAFATFAAGVALSGGIVDGDSVRTLLGVGVASFGPGLIAALFRPIRRPPAVTPDERWERLTDIAVVAVVGAMSVQLMVGALSGIAGYALPVSDIAGPLALASLPILALRVSLEEVTARHFPARMSTVIPEELPELPTWRQLVTLLAKAGGFVFVGLALIGPVWQLYVAALLFVLAPLVGLAGERLPNSPLLWRLLPQGIPGFVVMLVVGGWSAGLVEEWLGSTPDYAQMSFVALSAPYTLLALLALLGRAGAEDEERWVQAPQRRLIQRVGGVVMLGVLVRLHLG